MKYLDGSIISPGDVIRWNEGSNKGRVALIIETKEQQAEWGLTENGIFICTSLHNDELTCDVFYPEADFEDEGIAKIG